MRPLPVRYAYSLILGGSLCIAGAAAFLAFAPEAGRFTEIASFTFIAISALLIALGLYWYRMEGVAWRALADHLGQELLNLEAISTTTPDQYCAFGAGGIVATSPGFAALFGLLRFEKAEEVAEGLEESWREKMREAINNLGDSGAAFQTNVVTRDGRTLALSGHRAQVRPAQAPLFVLRAREISAEREALRREQGLREELTNQMEAMRARWEMLPTPVWVRGEDLSLTWVNRATAEALEMPVSAILDHQRELFVGQLGEDGRWLAEQAQIEGAARGEMAHAIVKGERRLFSVTEIPVNQPGAAFMGIAFDMTAVEEKEAELKRHIAGNAAVLERLGAAIAVFGPDQRLTFHNQPFVDVWGLDEAFLRTHPSFSEVLEDLRQKRRIPEQSDFRGYKADMQRLFTSLIEPTEELMHLPDGRILRSLIAPHPFGGLMFVYEDVSRRFELETSLNTLMAVQQETFNNLAEGTAVFGSDGKLKLFNPAYARIWNVPPEKLSGEPHANDVISLLRPFFNVADADWPALHAEIVALALDREVRTGRLMRADGSVLDYAGTPLPDGAVLHTFMDVTDAVRVEEALRSSNDALEAADRLKSEFIANITYQLRTPLTAIMGFAEMLNNQYFGPINARQGEYTAGIIEASQRLLTLINDILELASLEAGTIQLDRTEVNVRDMLMSVAALAGDWARQEELDLSIKVDDDIGTAWLDERRLRQALFNLLSNSIKFTPVGGRVELSAVREGNQLIMTVSDNGIGIAAADQARIFKRFERANIRTGQAGAGLGLSVVKSIVEMHGGRVEIQSAPNRGSRVRCILPVKAPTPTKTDKAKALA